MQAIVTKYHGATNFKGSRISATAEAGRIYLSWDDSLNVEDNHDAAALALGRKLGWVGKLASGGLPGTRGNAYVFVQPHSRPRPKTLTVLR
jgi:hypothetical protein